MPYEDILYEIEDKIATVTLNRPKVMNAISPGMKAEIHAAFAEADADENVRVIILTGAGAAFSAGYDQGDGKGGVRRTDPTGKSIAEFIEGWQRKTAETSISGPICGNSASRSSPPSTAGR